VIDLQWQDIRQIGDDLKLSAKVMYAKANE